VLQIPVERVVRRILRWYCLKDAGLRQRKKGKMRRETGMEMQNVGLVGSLLPFRTLKDLDVTVRMKIRSEMYINGGNCTAEIEL